MDVGSSSEVRRYPRGMRDVLYHTLKADGIRGIYQGYGIALSGVIVYRALHLGGYDACKTEMMHWRRGSARAAELTLTERFCAAQFVSIVAGTACYPIDSVRRRLMMQAGIPKERRMYYNSFDCFRKVWKMEGIKGFYLGIGPNIFRSFGGSVLLVGYDLFKGMIY
jgi:solute carrier family 25 (adenine nucleotide translocator) protein 4/5/6/31